MIKRLVLAIVLLGLVAGGVVGFNMFRDQAIEDFFANRPVQPLPVDTVVAEAGEWVPTLEAIGTVYALRGIDLAVEAVGVVREVSFEANDTVEAGQVLVRIGDEIEQADLAAAESAVRLAQQTLDRVNSLGDRGVASEATINEAEAALSSARAQVQRTRALIEQKALVAPFTGDIGIPKVEEGQYVAAGATVATLQDLDMLRVDFSLPEQELPQIEIGQPVDLISEAGGHATGFITGIEPRIDPATRLVSVRAEIDNTDGALSPGQFVRVQVRLPAEDGVVALPQTTITTSLYGDFVYAVAEAEEGGTLEARQVFVDTGSRQNNRVEIVRGVAAGDRVVVAGQNRLSNGAPVTLEDARADGDADGAAGGDAGEAAAEDAAPAQESAAGAVQAAEAGE
ncbi:efflux RND transporter periplasmic adaptor subunit [Roseitranquillus sediminis]|uniref:efflux RND transporter periplasmic adaptor subunit n=1 Tax=Roseitranquillus sediminis TaxID=2809051 RepID=UPI001D0C83FB|nr:efflux RND transporter periplasmic adaptor subunit [Roseitranquillus sediminis]MBM9594577.1 efflux RND transporter periplasmic adaptor subunit [Roseitranquillus sediminis]